MPSADRARTFMFTAAGLAMLAVASTLIPGSARTQAPAPVSAGEVVVLSGVARDGDMIPLPAYGDGTIAREDECHWLVSPSDMGAAMQEIAHFYCYTSGRRVVARWINQGGVSDRGKNGNHPGSANYLIVARRGSAPARGPGEPIRR